MNFLSWGAKIYKSHIRRGVTCKRVLSQLCLRIVLKKHDTSKTFNCSMSTNKIRNLRLYFSTFVEVSFLIFHSLLVSVPTGKTADSWCLRTERRKKFLTQTEEGTRRWTYIHDKRLSVSPFSKSIHDKLCWFVIICCQGILGLTG